MKINAANFKSFTLAELFRFFSRMDNLVVSVGVENLGVSKQYNSLFKPALDKLDDAYKKSKSSKYTGKIVDVEKLLTNATTSITGTVAIKKKSSNAQIKAAAENLEFELNPYRGITKRTRREQIADTKNMLQILKGDGEEYVTKLGLTELVEELDELYNTIDAYEASRTKEKADKGRKDSAEARNGIIRAYRIFCKAIDVGVATDGLGDYEEFIRNLNVIIQEFGGSGTSSGNSGSTAPRVEDNDEDDTDNSDDDADDDADELSNEEKYPNAKEWEDDLPFQGVENGDIYYIMVNGKKVFYELVDKQKFFWHPESEKAAGGWEKL